MNRIDCSKAKIVRPQFLTSLSVTLVLSLLSILANAQVPQNFVTNGSFEDTPYNGQHGAPGGWTLGGTPNRGGLLSSSSRASDGNQLASFGSWSNEAGMELSQDITLTTGQHYVLKFNARIGSGSGEGYLITEVFDTNDNNALDEQLTLIDRATSREFSYEFTASSNAMTLRFSHALGSTSQNHDLDLDNVRIELKTESLGDVNLIQNGSFERAWHSGLAGPQHTTPENWTISGTAHSGGLIANAARATNGTQLVMLGGWSNNTGMQLNQDLTLTPGATYELAFDARLNFKKATNATEEDGDTVSTNLLVEVFDSSPNKALTETIVFQSVLSKSQAMQLHRYQFTATSAQMTIRFTHASQSAPVGKVEQLDLDLDNVRLLPKSSAPQNLNKVTNGSFEDSPYTNQHQQPSGWILGGPSNRGGLGRNSSRSSEGEQFASFGGWGSHDGMQLSQVLSLNSGESYDLIFDALLGYGSGNGKLLVEVLDQTGTRVLNEVEVVDKADGWREIRHRFTATDDQMTLRFTHQLGSTSEDHDLDVDYVRVYSTPTLLTEKNFNLSTDSVYQLSFDAQLIDSQAGILSLEVEDSNGAVSLLKDLNLTSTEGERNFQYQFLATTNQMTVRLSSFTESGGSMILDPNLVQVQSAPFFQAVNGMLKIEAEEAIPVGNWRRHTFRGETTMLYDSLISRFDEPDEGRALNYIFKTNEAAIYRFGLLSGTYFEAYGARDPGQRFSDLKNNDVWLSLYNARTNQVVRSPIRVLTNNWNTGYLRWANYMISGGQAQYALEANTEYRLEIAGLGDGFVLDHISIRSGAHRENTDAFRYPDPASEQTPKLPVPLMSSVNLTQYPDMEEWSRAGVTGGIPRNIQIVKTIQPGENIQTAVDEVSNQGGGAILLTNGIYTVNDTISMKENVVLRGEDREETKVHFTYFGDTGKSLFYFNKRFAGVENLTMKYIAPDGLKPPVGVYSAASRGDMKNNLVTIPLGASNNWVKGCNILDAGFDPVSISGFHNTMMDNYVEGAHNKSGGQGYYRIEGRNNLIKGEVVKNLRHFSILARQGGSRYNVVTDCFFATDINYHVGDGGYNLFEGNTVALPRWHGWDLIASGVANFHIPPGCNNLIVNNVTQHAINTKEQGWSQEGLVYLFEGFGKPLATNIPVPQGGRFYVPDHPQLTFADPTPPNRATLAEGSDIGVEVQSNVELQNMKLYLNGILVRQEGFAPWQWGASDQNDPPLENLSKGKYNFRAVATLTDGSTLEESFQIIVDSSHDLDQKILGASSFTYNGSTKAGGSGVRAVNDGDWVKFDRVLAKGADFISVRASSSDAGGPIEIRKGSPTGPLLGTVNVNNTGDSNTFENFYTTFPELTEPVDIYLTLYKGYTIDSFQLGSSSDIGVVQEAEDYTAQNGTRLYTNGGTTLVGSIDNGDWLCFDGQRIGGANHWTAKVASDRMGGTIELRTGSLTGALLGTANVSNTGGWWSFEEVVINFPPIVDETVTDIYLVFKGGSGALFNIESFQFGVSTDIGSLQQAEDYTEENGTGIATNGGITQVGNINNDDWLRFDGQRIGGADHWTATVSSDTAGGTIELRTGSLTGPLLGSVDVGNTGGWGIFEDVTINFPPISNRTVLDVYLVFKGGNGYLFNVESFTFGKTNLSFVGSTLSVKSVFPVGLDILSEVLPSHEVSNISLYINDSLIRVEGIPPYTWGEPSQGDTELKNIPEGSYTLRAEATLLSGAAIKEEKQFTVVDINGTQVGFSMTMNNDSNQMEFTWDGPGMIMQSSSNLDSWSLMSGTSPLTVPIDPNKDHQFYRLIIE